jgi:hypothetical protein
VTDDQLKLRFQFPDRPAIRWRKLANRPRINRCGVCAIEQPAFFDVPGTVWRFYVPPDERAQILCLGCWRKLVVATDDGACQRAHGGPLALWCPAWRKRCAIPEDEPPYPFRLHLWREGVRAGVPERKITVPAM